MPVSRNIKVRRPEPSDVWLVQEEAALATINSVMDKIIDAYARAVALASKDPQQTAAKNAWLARLTELYKFRHDGSNAGLNELIAGVLATPLPQ